jgi:hypothetical protein
MASEIRLTHSLQVTKGSLQYRSNPTAWVINLNGSKAPGPGQMIAATGGSDISLAHLNGNTPGLCWVQNLDATNSVTLGRYDGTTGYFYPLMKLKPGEAYVFRLSPDVLKEHVGSGTPDTGHTSTLRVQAENAPCNIQVHIFED